MAVLNQLQGLAETEPSTLVTHVFPCISLFTEEYIFLQIELQNSQEKVRHILCSEWDQLVRIENAPNDPVDPNLKRVVIGMEDGQGVIKNLIQAMHASDVLAYR